MTIPKERLRLIAPWLALVVIGIVLSLVSYLLYINHVASYTTRFTIRVFSILLCSGGHLGALYSSYKAEKLTEDSATE